MVLSKKVIVNTSYSDVITDLISKSDGKARLRTVTYNQLQDAVDRLDTRLDLPKKYKEGIVATIDVNYFEHYSKEYRNAHYGYDAQSTKVVVMYYRGEWRLMEIYRDKCSDYMFVVRLTPEAEKILCDRYIDRMSHWS